MFYKFLVYRQDETEMLRIKFVCSIFLIWNCSGEVFKIIRRPGLNDEFEVSSGGSNSPVVCNDYGADTTNTDQKCVCNLNSAKNSTFGHFDHRWQCFDFREILKNQGILAFPSILAFYHYQ